LFVQYTIHLTLVGFSTTLYKWCEQVRRAMGLAVLPDDNDDDLDSPAPSPADYFRSPTSASSGKQSAATAVAAATMFADYEHDPRAVARTGDWMVECGVPINDVTVRNALLDVIKSSRNNESSVSSHLISYNA
jgi:hypothetical protein